MNTLVGSVFGGVTGANTPTVGFFNGSIPSGSTDYVGNLTARGILAGALVAYFGKDLGCNEAGFPSYNGTRTMAVVHANMPINNATFNYFNSIFYSVAQNAGVNATDLATVASYLEGFRTQICNQADCQPATTTGTAMMVIPMIVVSLIALLF